MESWILFAFLYHTSLVIQKKFKLYKELMDLNNVHIQRIRILNIFSNITLNSDSGATELEIIIDCKFGISPFAFIHLNNSLYTAFKIL